MQRLAHVDRRVFTPCDDLQESFELALRGWIGGRAFEHDIDSRDGPAFVIADLRVSGHAECNECYRQNDKSIIPHADN